MEAAIGRLATNERTRSNQRLGLVEDRLNSTSKPDRWNLLLSCSVSELAPTLVRNRP